MSFPQRLEKIRAGFEPSFWVANVSEIFERLAYYGSFASLAVYLQETLNGPTEQTGTLAGIFGGAVWFLAIFGGAVADRLGFRRALSTAYFILSVAYFLLGSVGASWLAPIRNAIPLELFVGFILVLPALGISLVKPSVVGTTARASKENVRSLGYSIYYTLVNIGGASGPLAASFAHRYLGAGKIFLIAALAVFLMFFVVLIFFREPKKAANTPTPSVREVARNFCLVLGKYKLVLPVVGIAAALWIVSLAAGLRVPVWVWILLLAVALAGISRFMWFLVIFTGYWIVFWQQWIVMPVFLHRYVDPHLDVELVLVTDGIIVITCTILVNYLTRKIPAFQAIILGTLITGVSWLVLAFHPTMWGAIAGIFVLAIGEIVHQPRYYEYISRLAPPDQEGTYMGFAFLPLGIGSLIGGWFGGKMLHYFGEVQGRPERTWYVITGVGVLTAVLLYVYDRIVKPQREHDAARHSGDSTGVTIET